MANGAKPRLYGYDNIKFILIFLVVLGHLLEMQAPEASSDLVAPEWGSVLCSAPSTWVVG